LLGFGIIESSNSRSVIMPYWFLVVSAVALSASPWFWSWRFSLRTLLIAMTLIAVFLGLVAVSIENEGFQTERVPANSRT
jgi:hypothetical protein